MTEIENLPGFMVIDKDTGTVLGTQVVLVPVPDEMSLEDILSSDSEARAYAQRYGYELFVDRDYDDLDFDSMNAQNDNLL